MDQDQFGRVIYLVLILAALGGWAIVEYRNRLGQALRTALAWGMIFVGVMAAYGLWTDIEHDIIPQQMATSDGRIEVPRAADGHYYLTLDLNGTPVRFMADTGASNIVLSKDDASRLGFDPATLIYLGEAMTANGPVRTAHVTLDEVRLGPFDHRGVSAFVNDGEMDGSLLGMDYLGRFRIEIAGDTMVLSP